MGNPPVSHLPKGYVWSVGSELKLADLRKMQTHCADCVFLDNCTYAREIDSAVETGRAPAFIEPLHYVVRDIPGVKPYLICVRHEHVVEQHR